MGQKTTKEIMDDLAVEPGTTSGGENEPSGGDEGDDEEEEPDDGSTTSGATQKKQKTGEGTVVPRYHQTTIPGSNQKTGSSPSSQMRVPPSSQEEKTPTNKKRKKGESNDAGAGLAAAAGGTFAVDTMEPIRDELVDPLVVQRKIWKGKHKLGKHDIPPDKIQDPLEIWRARAFDLDHVDALMTSFQQTMKMNSKGVLLVLQDTELWSQWQAMNPATRSSAMEENSPFIQRCLLSAKAFRPFAGDHTRLAATKLMKKFPLGQKWKLFKGVKMYIADETDEDDNVLRDLGNMHNTIAALHRELAFKDKIRQIHAFYRTNRLLVDETSAGKRVADGSGKTKPFLNGLAQTWGVKANSMGQYVALGKLGGKAWDLLDLILDGKYKVLVEGRLKALTGPPPKATSFFNKMGGIPVEALILFFQDIVDGKLLLQKLPDACDRFKLMKGLKLYIVAIAAQLRPQANIFNWETLRTVVPAACTTTFLDSWVSSLKMKGDKVTDAPESLKQAIIDMMTTQVRRSLILIKSVSVSIY